MDNITLGLVRSAGTGDGEIFQANHAVLIQMDGIQAKGRGRVTKRFVLDLGIGNPAQQVGETRGKKVEPCFFPLRKGHTSQ